MTAVILEQACKKCRGNEATPCAELEKEEKVQLLKVIVDSLKPYYATVCVPGYAVATPCISHYSMPSCSMPHCALSGLCWLGLMSCCAVTPCGLPLVQFSDVLKGLTS